MARAGKVFCLNHNTAKLDADIMSNSMAEADHRIANHLAMLGSYVRLKGARLVERDKVPSVEDVRCLTQLIIAQIDAISDVHGILSDQENPDSLDLSVPLARICDAMQAGVAGEADIVRSLGKNCDIALQSILPVTQICAEIITNAVKYGCSSKSLGNVRVSCHKSSATTVVVEVSDTGPGLPDTSSETRKEGLGLRLIDGLILQAGGQIEYISTPRGLTVRVELPSPRAANGTFLAPNKR